LSGRFWGDWLSRPFVSLCRLFDSKIDALTDHDGVLGVAEDFVNDVAVGKVDGDEVAV